MLNLIFLYFTKKTRQKTHNSNFKNLYLRIQKELETREKENKKKITQIEEVNIPNFFNDKSNFPISKINTNNFINCNSSISLSTASCEEETLRDEIERLKQEKYDLMNEMSLYKKNNDNDKEIEPDINKFSSL